MEETNAAFLFQLAVQHHQSGRLHEASVAYQQVLQLEPNHAEALHLQGVVAYQMGQSAVAVERVERAIRLQQDVAAFHNTLGVIVAAMGHHDRAVECFERALSLDANSAEAFFNLGGSLGVLQRLDEAVAAYRKSLQFRPDSPEELDEAESCFRRALTLNPQHVLAMNNLGNVLHRAGRTPEALEQFATAIRLNPSYAQAYSNMGIALLDLGRPKEALAALQQAVSIQPALAEAHYLIGNALRDLEEADAAEKAYQDALRHRPNYPAALLGLGNIYRRRADIDRAEAAYKRVLQLDPTAAEAYHNLGTIAKDQGNIHAAIRLLREAVARQHSKSDDAMRTHSNLCYALHFDPLSDPQSIYDEHRRWHERFELPLKREIRPHDNDRNPHRRLRVGYVSPDFYLHPVGRFLLPILRNHNRDRFQIYGYAHSQKTDVYTAKIRSVCDAWREIRTLNDAALAQQIRDDRIDILVDLSAHLNLHRLLTFARKPAPVQLTYLAYCSTTGLDAFDGRLSDPYLDPIGTDERFYSERTLRLAHSYWCYEPPTNAPEIGPAPVLANGYVTFGCLNNLAKLSEPVLRAWAQIMTQLPTSRLVLHAVEGKHRSQISDSLQKLGIEAKRLRFVGFVPFDEFLALHRELDIALDPFPYSGGTTSCDALWMGVPVVSLRGATAVGRGGASILGNLGATELLAQTVSGYVERALALAREHDHIERYRSSLRQRMLACPLTDSAQCTIDLEQVYRLVWTERCECAIDQPHL